MCVCVWKQELDNCVMLLFQRKIFLTWESEFENLSDWNTENLREILDYFTHQVGPRQIILKLTVKKYIRSTYNVSKLATIVKGD